MAGHVGHQLGNYRLVKLLGEGGYAEVYLGEHIHLGTQAAIKVLHTRLTSENAEQFLTEARTIARLEHPHIVRILDYGVEDKTPFLVLSYAPNGTLRQRHPKGTSLSLTTLVSYINQISEALQYAHDEKIIHRDIKPENMLVGRKNEILLSDFGLAQVTRSSDFSSPDQMAGTISYMAPEQIQGKPRRASDQYSLGIVVYEWLTGDRPFHGSFTEIATQHMLVSPTPLREKNSTIRLTTEEVVLKALSKEPQQRFNSVQDFAIALEHSNQPTLPYTIVYPGMSNIQSSSFQLRVEDNIPNPTLQPIVEPIQPIQTSYSTNIASPLERQSINGAASTDIYLQLPTTSQSKQIKPTIWQTPFIILLGLFFILPIVGCIIAFNIQQPYGPTNPAGLDHAVEFGLSALLLLVAIGATGFVHNGIAIVILLLTALSALVAGSGFLLQTLSDLQQSSSYVVPVDPNLLITIGLAAASLISLLWLTRPYTMIDRIILLAVFGIAAVCAFLQYSGADTDIPKHIYLLISLILLIQGVLIAAQTERVRKR